MKKNFACWLFASVVIMLALPWLTVTFIKGDVAMAVCFLLFYAVNPIYFFVSGIFSGRDIAHLWNLPVISTGLFLVGTWIFFDMGETAFILYAFIYLILGITVMLLSMLLKRKHHLKIRLY